MKVKVSSVRDNFPSFYPRDVFTVIKSEEHRSLLETSTGARQWVGNSFLLDEKGNALTAALSALEDAPQQESVAAELVDANGFGWVYWNPDSGEEYSLNHPIESGECEDAERIRSSTAQEDVLYEAMQGYFQQLQALSHPSTPATGSEHE